MEQQLGLEIRKLTIQIQVRRAGTPTVASFCVGGGSGARNISETWNLLGVSAKFYRFCFVHFLFYLTFYYGKLQTYTSREKGIMESHIPTTEALTMINSWSILFDLCFPSPMSGSHLVM